MQILWWILFGLSAINYITLVGFVLPKLFFKVGEALTCSLDRGIKNYKEKNGRSIVFEPNPESKKYIKQYILSNRNGIKGILCKLNSNVSYIEFDINVFNCNNKSELVLSIRQEIVKPGLTQFIELPSSTAYVGLTVNKINNSNVLKEGSNNTTLKSPALFVVICAALGLLEVFFAKQCLAMIYGDVFYDAFMSTSFNIFITVGIGAIVVLINLAIVLGYLKLSSRKRVGS